MSAVDQLESDDLLRSGGYPDTDVREQGRRGADVQATLTAIVGPAMPSVQAACRRERELFPSGQEGGRQVRRVRHPDCRHANKSMSPQRQDRPTVDAS